jgi:hypothetical protein
LFPVILPFALLLAPTPVDAQTPGPLSVVVLPFGIEKGPFVESTDYDFGRAVAADVATQIEGKTTYGVLDLDVFIDASPIAREFDEEARARFNCTLARQVAVAENLDVVLWCGSVLALRTGFEIETVVFTTPLGLECRLPPATVEDRSSAVRHVVAQFEGWALGEAICQG